ncbi:TetR/AcrR family transcriptional regulator, partial [Halomonas sp. AOP5-CZ2-32]
MKNGRDTINQTAWIDTAYELLIASGVSAVKIVPLAKKLKTSRTSFYWLFKDRVELLSGVV